MKRSIPRKPPAAPLPESDLQDPTPNADVWTLVMTIIRSVIKLAAAGGVVVAWYNDTTVGEAVSAAVALGGIVWSLYRDQVQAKITYQLVHHSAQTGQAVMAKPRWLL